MKTKTIVLLTVVVALFAVTVGAVAAQEGDDDNRRRPFGREGLFDRPIEERPLVGEIIAIIQGQIDIDRRDMLQALHDDTTLAEIITEQGGDVDAITAEVVALLTEEINARVEAGEIREEVAERMLGNLEANVTAAMNGELSETMRGRLDGSLRENFQERRADTPDILRPVVRAIIAETDLTVEEIRQQLVEGATLAEVLAGEDVESFTADLIAVYEERLTQAVENERLTTEESENRLAIFTQRLDTVLNHSFADEPVEDAG